LCLLLSLPSLSTFSLPSFKAAGLITNDTSIFPLFSVLFSFVYFFLWFLLFFLSFVFHFFPSFFLGCRVNYERRIGRKGATELNEG
jgi:hypothetical protein